MIIGYTSNEGLLWEFQNIIKKMKGLPITDPIKSIDEYIPWQVGLEKGSTSWKNIVEQMQIVYHTGENKDNKYLVSMQ